MSDAPLVPVALLPPGIKDERQEALVRLLDEALSSIDLSILIMADPMTVDARLLPYMIREFSAQEFISPDLPETVQRRILKRVWDLHSLKGYDAGVKLGLELMGMTATIDHWHQQTPIGAPNTHRLTVLINDVLYPDEGGYFAPRQLGAMQRMIDATKRWSQDTELRIGVGATGPSYVGAFATTKVLASAEMSIEPPPIVELTPTHAIVATTQLTSTVATA